MIGPIMKKRGFVLVFALCFITLIVLICVTYSLIAANSLATSNSTTNWMRAYYIADAGLADAFVKLRTPGYSPTSDFDVSDSNYTDAFGNRIGSYSAHVHYEADSLPSKHKYTIASTGTYNGVSKTLQKILQLKVFTISITDNLYISNTEIDQFGYQEYWGTGNILDGPYYTNGQLNVFGFPVFKGLVSQHADTVNYWTAAPYGPQFNGGLKVGAPIVNLPEAGYFTGQIKGGAGSYDGSSNPYYLKGQTIITLFVDTDGEGKMLIFNADSSINDPSIGRLNADGSIAKAAVALPIPPNHAVFVEDIKDASGNIINPDSDSGTVTIHGRLKGNLTIGADNTILINDSIIYNTDPRTDPSSTDMLGLVTNGDVVLKDPTLTEINHPEIPDADINVEIDASIVTLSGCFQLENFDRFLKGNLIMYGALACNFYGPNGVFNSSGTLIAGYYQQQIYDTRLMSPSLLQWYPPVKDGYNRISYFKKSFVEDPPN